jgi:hypothetical protein
VGAILEGGDDPEVAAAPAQRPELRACALACVGFLSAVLADVTL